MSGAIRNSLLFYVPVLLLALNSAGQDDPVRPKAHGVLVNDFQAPISFEPNQGQSDMRVKFVARGLGYDLFLTPSNALLLLGHDRPRDKDDLSTDVVSMNVVGANPAAKITGRDKLPGKSSYFLGTNPNSWITNIPNFGRVQYEDIYPGIDLVYHGIGGQLEYDFVLHPGALPSVIAIEFTGTKDTHLSRNGELVLGTERGQICFHQPSAYQEQHGNRHALAAHYRQIGKNRWGFSVGAYDSSKTLVIDPVLDAESSPAPGSQSCGKCGVPQEKILGLKHIYSQTH